MYASKSWSSSLVCSVGAFSSSISPSTKGKGGVWWNKLITTICTVQMMRLTRHWPYIPMGILKILFNFYNECLESYYNVALQPVPCQLPGLQLAHARQWQASSLQAATFPASKPCHLPRMCLFYMGSLVSNYTIFGRFNTSGNYTTSPSLGNTVKGVICTHRVHRVLAMSAFLYSAW